MSCRWYGSDAPLRLRSTDLAWHNALWMVRLEMVWGPHTARNVLADLSYPLDRISHGWVQGYCYLQTIVGYSENLLEYDHRVDQPRILIGFAITR